MRNKAIGGWEIGQVVAFDRFKTPYKHPCNCVPQAIWRSNDITGKGGKPFAFVGCDTLVIRRSDTGDKKRLVDIHPATEGINNFEHNTSPQRSI